MCGWSSWAAARGLRRKRRRSSGDSSASGRGDLQGDGAVEGRVEGEEDDAATAAAQLAFDAEARAGPAVRRRAGCRSAPVSGRVCWSSGRLVLSGFITTWPAERTRSPRTAVRGLRVVPALCGYPIARGPPGHRAAPAGGWYTTRHGPHAAPPAARPPAAVRPGAAPPPSAATSDRSSSLPPTARDPVRLTPTAGRTRTATWTCWSSCRHAA